MASFLKGKHESVYIVALYPIPPLQFDVPIILRGLTIPSILQTVNGELQICVVGVFILTTTLFVVGPAQNVLE